MPTRLRFVGVEKRKARPMFGVSDCPVGFHLPFDSLVTVAWLLVAALCADLVALTVGAVAQSAWHDGTRRLAQGDTRTPRLLLTLILSLILGLTVALGLTFSLQRQNLALCFSGDLHYTPQLAAHLDQIIQNATTPAYATFTAILAIAAVGSVLTLLTLRRPRRAASDR